MEYVYNIFFKPWSQAAPDNNDKDVSFEDNTEIISLFEPDGPGWYFGKINPYCSSFLKKFNDVPSVCYGPYYRVLVQKYEDSNCLKVLHKELDPRLNLWCEQIRETTLVIKPKMYVCKERRFPVSIDFIVSHRDNIFTTPESKDVFIPLEIDELLKLLPNVSDSTLVRMEEGRLEPYVEQTSINLNHPFKRQTTPDTYGEEIEMEEFRRELEDEQKVIQSIIDDTYLKRKTTRNGKIIMDYRMMEEDDEYYYDSGSEPDSNNSFGTVDYPDDPYLSEDEYSDDFESYEEYEEEEVMEPLIQTERERVFVWREETNNARNSELNPKANVFTPGCHYICRNNTFHVDFREEINQLCEGL